MSFTRLILLTSLAMLAFAGNSVLCRLALKHTGIDAASFTTVRLSSGVLVLWALARTRNAPDHASAAGRSASARYRCVT